MDDKVLRTEWQRLRQDGARGQIPRALGEEMKQAVNRMQREGHPVAEICQTLGISLTTANRWKVRGGRVEKSVKAKKQLPVKMMAVEVRSGAATDAERSKTMQLPDGREIRGLTFAEVQKLISQI